MKTFTARRCLVVLVSLSLLSLGGVLSAPPADAAIYRWDNGELITDRDAEPGAYFRAMDLGYADLAGASLFGSDFRESDLTRAHLMDADLTDADFRSATLTDADLSGAVVTAANFKRTTGQGFTAAQLYSTASYQGAEKGTSLIFLPNISDVPFFSHGPITADGRIDEEAWKDGQEDPLNRADFVNSCELLWQSVDKVGGTIQNHG